MIETRQPASRTLPIQATPVMIAGWALLLTFGFGALWRYELSPGEQADAPRGWPGASAVVPPEGKPTVVMFAHPRCPCTRASLGELSKICATAGDRANVD